MMPNLAADFPDEILGSILGHLFLHRTCEHDYDASDGYFRARDKQEEEKEDGLRTALHSISTITLKVSTPCASSRDASCLQHSGFFTMLFAIATAILGSPTPSRGTASSLPFCAL